MRRPIIAGNWKMHKVLDEAIQLANGIKRELYDIVNTDVVLCPAFTNLLELGEMLLDTNIYLGAQNMFWEEEGAFTGEVSPAMLKSVGCRYVIVGHSERRAYFGETNETVSKRIKAAIRHEMHVIVCVGERLEERDSGKTFEIIEGHLAGGLAGLDKKDMKWIIIAYEPVWAIGTGKTATPGQAQEVHGFIREKISSLFDDKIAEAIRIQYGGSIKPDNIEELMKMPDIDGGLVGGASLKVESFSAIVKKTSDVYKG